MLRLEYGNMYLTRLRKTLPTVKESTSHTNAIILQITFNLKMVIAFPFVG